MTDDLTFTYHPNTTANQFENTNSKNLPSPQPFSADELASWGMLRQVRREAAIDQCLKSIPAPPAEQLKAMLEAWCQQQRIDSPQTLQQWQKQQGLSPEQ